MKKTVCKIATVRAVKTTFNGRVAGTLLLPNETSLLLAHKYGALRTVALCVLIVSLARGGQPNPEERAGKSSASHREGGIGARQWGPGSGSVGSSTCILSGVKAGLCGRS